MSFHKIEDLKYIYRGSIKKIKKKLKIIGVIFWDRCILWYFISFEIVQGAGTASTRKMVEIHLVSSYEERFKIYY